MMALLVCAVLGQKVDSAALLAVRERLMQPNVSLLEESVRLGQRQLQHGDNLQNALDRVPAAGLLYHQARDGWHNSTILYGASIGLYLLGAGGGALVSGLLPGGAAGLAVSVVGSLMALVGVGLLVAAPVVNGHAYDQHVAAVDVYNEQVWLTVLAQAREQIQPGGPVVAPPPTPAPAP
jgi:hypothetical protein